MRGDDRQQGAMFSYLSPEERVPRDHPLRAIRQLVDRALTELSPRFSRLYARLGRPSIPPEQLLRALLVQVLYTVRSERQLMEQLDYNLLFRWFVGLNLDEPVWAVTVFTKNRERLLRGDVAEAFFQAVLGAAERAGLLSQEHFPVDGTLVQAWAGQKSFRPRRERRRTVADDLFKKLIDDSESFWTAVYPLYMNREITRRNVRDVVHKGLEEARGNYKILLRLFNMDARDYKRFLNFLRKHGCHLSFKEYRQ